MKMLDTGETDDGSRRWKQPLILKDWWDWYCEMAIPPKGINIVKAMPS